MTALCFRSSLHLCRIVSRCAPGALPSVSMARPGLEGCPIESQQGHSGDPLSRQRRAAGGRLGRSEIVSLPQHVWPKDPKLRGGTGLSEAELLRGRLGVWAELRPECEAHAGGIGEPSTKKGYRTLLMSF